MADQTNQPGNAGQETRIKELTKENELLFDQLQVVQEELERYYYKLKECEQGKGNSSETCTSTVIMTQDPEILAENLKLHALIEQQQIALRVESTNSLASRLGEILIHGVSSAGAFITLPFKLCQLWKALDKTTPPAALGGKTFQKVLEVQTTGGAEAVEKQLDNVFLSPAMRANAYTAVARQCLPGDPQQAAAYARQAWETDPRPYRLKWLAFRLHDAHDAVTAEALLDMLPDDISMTESEERQAWRIRQESRNHRIQQAKEMANAASAGNEQLHATITKLKQTIEESKRQLEAVTSQLNKERSERKKELTHLNNQLTEQQNAAERARQEAAQANKAQSRMQQQMTAQKAESDALAVQTAQMLKIMLTRFESDKSVLSQVMRVVMGASSSK